MGGAREQAELMGLEILELDMTLRPMRDGETFQDVWNEQQSNFHSFLESLPANTGLVASGNGHARDALTVLRDDLDRAIPEGIGVILVDLSDNPGDTLAMIRLNGEQIGRRLVQRLLLQLRREEDDGLPVEYIPPLGFISGKSLRTSEVLQLYRRVKSWCEQRLREDVSVEDLCQEVGFSRRSLELKLKNAGLPPPYEILTRTRVDEAKRLLQTGTVLIGDVAERCGFQDARSLRKRFVAYTGMTPREWRKQAGESGQVVL